MATRTSQSDGVFHRAETLIQRHQAASFWVLIALFAATISLAPVLESDSIVWNLLISAAIVAAVCAIATTRLHLMIATLLGCLSILDQWISASLGPGAIGSALRIAGGSFFLLVFVRNTMILYGNHATVSVRLLAAITGYLMMIHLFAAVQLTILHRDPGAIVATADPASVPSQHELIYFSVVTQTTLGYGEIVPVAPAAKGASMLQAMLGVLFIAVTIGGLVGGAGRARADGRASRPPAPRNARAGASSDPVGRRRVRGDELDDDHGEVIGLRHIADEALDHIAQAVDECFRGVVGLPGRAIGESSTNLVDGRWIIATRGFEYDGGEGCTCWFAADDPAEALRPPTITPSLHAPRTVFRCADGVLRLFGNDRPAAAHPGDRSPLCCWDVDPVTFELTNRRIVLDARARGLPFHKPFVDMPKLSDGVGRRQLLMYRVITRRQTADQDPERSISAAEHAGAGVYCSQIVYDRDVPDLWEFALTPGS